MRVADELRHDGDAAEHEHAVEDPLPDAAEVKQSGERPRAGEGSAEHLGANQNGSADTVMTLSQMMRRSWAMRGSFASRNVS